MKRKSLLLLMLMVFFVPLAMNAQNTITLNGNLTQTIAPNTSYTFYDSGGPSGAYSNGETYTATFNCTGNITINFSQFATESSSGCYNWDYMLIYDGSASTGTLICRGQTGCASAALTTNTDYTATSGVMTVEWRSDGSTTAAGWTATITGPNITTPYIALNPISATVLTGSTKTLTATYGNVSGTPTITYTSSNNSVATVTGSGTSATVTAVAPGTATITATMNGSYTATCDITVEDPHACTPVLTSPTTSYYISNFTTTGGTNNINNTTSGTGASYSDYYNSYSATAYEGQTINFTITIAGGSTHGSAIWVDWNDDLEFSDNERVHQTSSYAATPHNGSFTVPTGATLGDHRMRIVTDYYNQQPSNPCSANTGEFEDYKLTVISQPSCMAPTDLALTTDGATVSATWTGTANTYNVEINGTPSPDNPITGTSHTFNVDLSTTYTVRVQANCDGGEISTWSDPVSITTPNCIGAHTINYTLNDSYGDGWNGASITVVEGCEQSSLTVSEGYSASGTLIICGNYFAFIWNTGDYDSECSFTFTEGGTTLFTKPSSVSDGLVLYSFGTATPIPTGLTVGTANTNSVELSWTENGNATAWEICVNDDETNLIPANTNNSFILSGLNTDTEYTVKVRSTNGTIESCWSDAITVHTAEACPVPTNLTVTNLMPTSATLKWEGEAESYNVRYRKAAHTVTLFSEGFENGIPSTWTTIDADGDGHNWFALSEISTAYPNGNYPELSGWAHSGSNAATSASYVNNYGSLNANDWLITPLLDLYGTLTFYVASTYTPDLDSYEVLLSTTGTSVSDFNVTLKEMTTASYYESNWDEVSIDLSSYEGQQGYIAIHHVSSNMYFLVVDDFEIYEEVGENWTPATAENGATSKDIDGLDPEYEYEWQVQADCGSEDGQSSWSAIATFTTPSVCTTPNGLNAEVAGNTANLSWTGFADTYDIQYREFDSTAPVTIILNVPTDIWEDGTGYQLILDADHNTYGTTIPETGNFTAGTFADFEYTIPENAECNASTTTIVVNGNATITIPAGVYDYVFLNPDPSSGTYYIASPQVFPSRGDDYEFEAGKTYEFTLSIIGTNDAITLTITDNGNAWTLIEGVSNPYTLENLNPTTTYEWQVQGAGCDNWSASDYFTTPVFYVKHIDAYDGENWYLIASPLAAETDPADVGNLIPANASNYALYRFNQAADLEWENYKTHTDDFVLEPGRGYLYANSTEGGVDLVFTGAAYDGDSKDVTLSKTAGAEFEGLNLVGNPFAVEAYIDREYYTMNETGTEIMIDPTTGAIGPMEGVFVEANQDNETLTFTTQNPAGKKGLVLNLSEGRGVGDRAVIRFGEGRTLHKFTLNGNSTKMYIPQEGEDFAVVRSRNSGEVTVNFEPAEDGVYSLSINAENLAVRTLILTDKVERVDIDMLRTPSYQFKASTTDPADRFVLSYKTGTNLFKEMDDRTEFGFFNNGSWMIDNEGEATLQVIDMNGRVLSSETINGNASIKVDAAPGVYMLRLINGDNVKVQKVVVE